MGGSKLTQASEGPLKGVKMTVMDILRFRDINMRTLPTQISDILSFLNRGAYMPPPGLIRVKYMLLKGKYATYCYQQADDCSLLESDIT